MGAKIYEFNRCQCFDLSCFVCYPSTVCYQIVLRDCVQVLHEHIAAGKQFDYVINDLTEFPVEKSVKGFGYDFETTSLITELSLKAVKDDGKLLARVSNVSRKRTTACHYLFTSNDKACISLLSLAMSLVSLFSG